MSYRYLLREELVERIKKNRAYSARAMARDLGLSTSFFNQVLNGKRSLKSERAHLIADQMKWPQAKAKTFIALLHYETAKDPKVKQKYLKELNAKKLKGVAFHNLNEDHFKLISNWYHFAVLELTLLEDFVPEISWIAKRIEISEAEAQSAVERLFKLGMLLLRNGKWVKSHKNFTTSNSVPSQANRNFHNQMLSLAKQKLVKSPITDRIFSSITMCGNPQQLEKWKKRILEFREEMMNEVESSRAKAVYQLSIQLIRLDEGKK